ncbi:MAG TPA: DUF2147 domain-containing protein [Candidatus Binatia bacterium]|jgi:uncharacterized protein (DUF2147 family)|nr:DUF2147 domain-containing protein [Candidatus Binatia bacterium]
MGRDIGPENGKVYRAKMKLDGEGITLRARGFIGFSLFRRTQIWIGEE